MTKPDQSKRVIGMAELQRAAQAVCNEQTNPSPQYRFVFPGYGIAVEVLIAAGVLDRADVQPGDDAPPFDPAELVRWADSYGHPEGWAKRAQALDAENEKLREEIQRLKAWENQ